MKILLNLHIIGEMMEKENSIIGIIIFLMGIIGFIATMAIHLNFNIGVGDISGGILMTCILMSTIITTCVGILFTCYNID